MWPVAPSAATITSPTIPAKIGTARSARDRPRATGWRRVPRICCRWQYFHVVFTIPAEIAQIAYWNKRAAYGLLFKASAETVMTIAADPKRMGARVGMNRSTEGVNDLAGHAFRSKTRKIARPARLAAAPLSPFTSAKPEQSESVIRPSIKTRFSTEWAGCGHLTVSVRKAERHGQSQRRLCAGCGVCKVSTISQKPLFRPNAANAGCEPTVINAALCLNGGKVQGERQTSGLTAKVCELVQKAQKIKSYTIRV